MWGEREKEVHLRPVREEEHEGQRGVVPRPPEQVLRQLLKVQAVGLDSALHEHHHGEVNEDGDQ
jgi:hypothetical protein